MVRLAKIENGRWAGHKSVNLIIGARAEILQQDIATCIQNKVIVYRPPSGETEIPSYDLKFKALENIKGSDEAKAVLRLVETVEAIDNGDVEKECLIKALKTFFGLE